MVLLPKKGVIMPDFLKLLDSLSGLSVKTDVRMREYTSFKIGGQAPVMVEPEIKFVGG